MDHAEFLNKLKRALQATNWNAQTTILLVLALVAGLGVVIAQRGAQPSSRALLFEGRDLTPSQLQRIEVALGKAGLADYQVDRGSLVVPSRRRPEYLAAIQDANCLPESSHTPTQNALDSTSFIETSRQQAQRMHHAREQEAKMAICRLRGIDDAFVFFDSKSDRSLRAKQRTTAVVGVRTAAEQPLDLRGFRMIQDMLLGFDSSLEVEGITVTDLTAGQSIRGVVAEPGHPQTDPIVQQGFELDWERQIQQALYFAPEVRVDVRATLAAESPVLRSLRISIGVPRAVAGRLGGLAENDTVSRDRVETTARTKIQAAIQPVLHAGAQIQHSVAVSFLPVPTEPPTSSLGWLPNSRPVTLSAVFVALLIGGVLVYARNRPPHPDKPRSFRVFEPDEVEEQSSKNETDAAAELRAYVEEDPDSVAKSLSDFIDRAS